MKTLTFLLCAAAVFAQAFLEPAKLLQPPTDSWPTYNGDYSGRRFSTLTKINPSNINSLSLAWVYRPNPGRAPQGGGGNTQVTIKGTPIMVNGVIYTTIPDHVWAVDARTGREIWHFAWPSKGGWHIGNRGVAVLRGHAVFRDAGFVSWSRSTWPTARKNGIRRSAIWSSFITPRLRR